MFNQLTGRLDPEKSSFYGSTKLVTGVDYRQRAITSDRRLPAFSQFTPIDMLLIQCQRLETWLNRDKTDCHRQTILNDRHCRRRAICSDRIP